MTNRKNGNHTTTIDSCFKQDSTKGTDKRCAFLAAARIKGATPKQLAEIEKWLKSIK